MRWPRRRGRVSNRLRRVHSRRRFVRHGNTFPGRPRRRRQSRRIRRGFRPTGRRMIASPRLFPHTSTPDGAADPDARWFRFPWGGPLVTAAFGFLAFLPYPAIPVGSSTGVQFGSLVTLVVALPCLLVPWRGKPYFLAP